MSQQNLLVLKTSSRRLQDMCWRCVQHVLSVTFFHLPTRLEDSWKRLAKTIWRRLANASWRHLEDFLKTCLEGALKTCLGDVLKTRLEDIVETSKILTDTYWRYLYLTNLNVYLTDLYFTNPYLTILRRIQSASLRTQ